MFHFIVADQQHKQNLIGYFFACVVVVVIVGAIVYFLDKCFASFAIINI
jgi:preprotein translocase subunit SecE